MSLRFRFMVVRDGNSHLISVTGQCLFGRFGVAGLLLVTPIADGTPAALLQRRGWWTDHGGTWCLPGGAGHRDNSPSGAAVREAVEETGLDPAGIMLRAAVVTAQSRAARRWMVDLHDRRCESLASRCRLDRALRALWPGCRLTT